MIEHLTDEENAAIEADPRGARYWTLDNGTIVGRTYVRRRILRDLASFPVDTTLDERKAAAEKTLAENGEQTVGSIIRIANDELWTIWSDRLDENGEDGALNPRIFGDPDERNDR